jgi:hypothetical protein
VHCASSERYHCLEPQACVPLLTPIPATPAAVTAVQEPGWNAIDFTSVDDCWARDIHTINADNGVLMSSECSRRLVACCLISQTRSTSIVFWQHTMHMASVAAELWVSAVCHKQARLQ